MQYLKIYAIASVIALLVFSSTASTQTQENPPKTQPPGSTQPEQSKDPSPPPKKFIKHSSKVIANRYIVGLRDDVVSDKEPLEVRRAAVTAIANRHAQTYGGKYDYIYETALKGYAITLPNEEAAIAISKLPEVRWVEEDAVGSFDDPTVGTQPRCSGKQISVSLLEVGGPKIIYSQPRRTSLLHGGITQRTRLAIRNRDEFSEFWKQLTATTSFKPPLPDVDFTREIIVVAAMGEKPSSGYEIIIEGACEMDNQIEVFVRSFDTIGCGMQLQVVTAPVDIVRLPRTGLPVVFREAEISYCK